MDKSTLRADAKMLRTWASVAIKTLRLGAVVALAHFRPHRAAELWTKWAVDVLDRLGIVVRTEDRAQFQRGTRGALYVNLNQQTLLESAIWVPTIPCRWIINVEYAALPLVGWATVAMGAVTIVRQRPAQAKRALAHVVEEIRRGEVFGMSIEGQRTKDGQLSPFKKGPAVIAIEAQCDIIPFMAFGEYELWPHGSWHVHPGCVDLVFYPPISTQGLGYSDRDRIVAELHALAEREISARSHG